MKILVVDDQDVVRRAIRDMLSIGGHDVDSADSGQAGADMVEATDYDVVFVDYNMPPKGGAWFLKNAKIAKRTKVLLLTAFANREIIEEIMSLGAAGYLVKPITCQDLETHLKFHTSPRPVADAA